MSSTAIVVPIPKIDVNVRVATLDDLPFIDALQKKHNHMVGFMKTKALEGKIAAGEVLVAVTGHSSLVTRGETSSVKGPASDEGQVTNDIPVGYCIGTDRYFKHDDVGIIYQLNVSPGRQRGFVGATLLKAMFDRAAYGCRLFCCWCAQDIEANRFWEAMGFVPLAYRAGGARKVRTRACPERASASRRVHIFWQKRIREGDRGQGGTPWWFPSQTTGGAIREDRIVLPIPPGTHWSDAKPLILPGQETQPKLEALPPPRGAGGRSGGSKPTEGRNTTRQPVSRRSGLSFVAAAMQPAKAERPKRERKAKATGPERCRRKNDPRLVAAARELKDRWLEHVNGAGGAGGMLIEGEGKYDLTRALPARVAGTRLVEVGPVLLLPAA